LPAARLAEAIAAKGLLLQDEKLMRAAAETCPKEARYWLLLARSTFEDLCFDDYGTAEAQVDERHRHLLELALRVDPDYLPALYAYAMSKPSHDKRMQALDWLVIKDADNAEPYYLMAIERFFATMKNRKLTAASNWEAWDMSHQEWGRISDFVEKGNRCSTFEWRAVQVPSARDLKLSTRGRLWPARAVENTLKSVLDVYGGTAEWCYRPQSRGSYFQGDACQAKWASRAASKAGDSEAALRYLTVMMDRSYKIASCKPERMECFVQMMLEWEVAETAAIELYKKSNNLAAVRKLRAEEPVWQRACEQCAQLLARQSITVKSVKVSRKDYLTYNDYAIEEAGMKKILAGLRP
jgi:hypothetical protein